MVPRVAGSRFAQGVDLSAAEVYANSLHARRSLNEAMMPNPAASPDGAGIRMPVIAIGSFRATPDDSGGNPAHRRANFRLEGVSLFGSSVSGSVDGRSAHLTFTWRTSP
ncbi:MAG TPA: hypothetical protein VGF97_10655 [Rhizomicrobium sp.]